MNDRASNPTVEYRVVWKREGLKPKRKRYATLKGAERFMLLFGPEPWRAFTKNDPDRYECCDGHECGCGGVTYRERAEEKRDGQPKLEYVRLEAREVGQWGQAGRQGERE